MSGEMREQIDRIKNWKQSLNENFEENKWIPFDNTLLLDNNSDNVKKYSIVTNTQPYEIYIKNDKLLVSFKPKIYSLTKEQVKKLSEIDFIEYDMDDYGVSKLTFKNY